MMCPCCPAELAVGKLTCSACGAPVARACLGCGRVNDIEANFCPQCGGAQSDASRPAGADSARTFERRVVTVMFCDLVGSIALTAGLDPEDANALLAGYLAWARGIIEAGGGTVAQYRGDGIVAYFGYPAAREDDAVRAIRSGLELIRSDSRSVVQGERLRVHIGAATGLVVISDLERTIGDDRSSIIGHPPNLAARLQALAGPGEMVIDNATRDIAAGMFEYADLGARVIKGFAEPLRVWQVKRLSAVESRFEAAHDRVDLTTMVDRKQEMGTLRRLWECALAGDGHAVLLAGEPGIGKSRLTLALREIASNERSASLRYYCSAYHTNSALHPLVSQIERAARFAPDDQPAVKLDKIERLIAPFEPEIAEVGPLYAALLSVPAAGRYAPLRVTAQRQRIRTIEAIEAQIGRLAAKTPVLLIFEDVQWADASTLEFLERMIERVGDLPILLVMTCRPECVPRWEQISGLTCLTVGRLSRDDSKALLRAVIDKSTLEHSLWEEILARSDGVPLFVEEVAKAVLETGKLGADGTTDPQVRTWPEGGPVPKALYASLMARLDQLSSWRRVAQTAAVIGRQFSFELIAALFAGQDAYLAEALQQLTKAELIIQRNEPPRATYTFKHHLVQDVAYASLLRAERRQIHERIARMLEKGFPEIAANQPELLARHYDGAGLVEPAIECWRQAGVRAHQRSAQAEAIEAFRRALSLLDKLPETRERDARELDLQFQLGAALTAARGFAAPELAAAYQRARELTRQTNDPEQQFRVLRGLWIYQLVGANLQAARDLASEMSAMAGADADAGNLIEACRAAGMTLLWLGEFTAAREQLANGALLYDPARHHSHALRYGNDPGIACIVHEAFALWMLGYPDQALSRSRDAVALARRLDHPFSVAQSLVYLCFIHQLRREPDSVAKASAEAKALAEKYGYPFWLAEFGHHERLGDGGCGGRYGRLRADVFGYSGFPGDGRANGQAALAGTSIRGAGQRWQGGRRPCHRARSTRRSGGDRRVLLRGEAAPARGRACPGCRRAGGGG